jgi:hypothetical protein
MDDLRALRQPGNGVYVGPLTEADRDRLIETVCEGLTDELRKPPEED